MSHKSTRSGLFSFCAIVLVLGVVFIYFNYSKSKKEGFYNKIMPMQIALIASKQNLRDYVKHANTIEARIQLQHDCNNQLQYIGFIKKEFKTDYYKTLQSDEAASFHSLQNYVALLQKEMEQTRHCAAVGYDELDKEKMQLAFMQITTDAQEKAMAQPVSGNIVAMAK